MTKIGLRDLPSIATSKSEKGPTDRARNQPAPTSRSKSDRAVLAAILLVGSGGMIGQLLLIRVLMVVFHGNELTLGIVIACWLLFEGAGSYLGGRLASPDRSVFRLFVFLLLLFSLALPAVIVLAHWLGGSHLGLVAGQDMGLGYVVLTAVATIGVTGILHGILYPLSANLLGGNEPASQVSLAYLIEIVGAVAGSLVFVFILATRATALSISLGLLVLHLLIVTWLLLSVADKARPGRAWLTAAVSAMLALVASFFFAGHLQDFSLSRLWPQGRLVENINSPHGNIAVLERDSEHTVLYDGRPIITLPHPDTGSLKDYAWLSALSHPNPADVLVLGGGLGGLVSHLLEHPVENLTYTELDPRLLEVLANLESPTVQAEFTSPRISIVARDGRLYLHRSEARFDLVVIGLVDVQTLQTNRFYTEEFFRMVRDRMRPGGVMAMSLPGSVTYLEGVLAALNACLFQTASLVFEHVMLVPGDKNMILASNEPIKLDSREAARRLEERGLYGGMFSERYLAYRLEPQRIFEFTSIVEETSARPNRDFRPVGFFLGLGYWGSAFAPQALEAVSTLRSIPLPWYGIAFLFLIGVSYFFLFRSRSARANRLTFTISTTGVAAMAFDVFVLLAFQSLFGDIYQLTGLFIAACMLGMFMGGAIALRHTRQAADTLTIASLLFRLDVAIALFLVGFLPLVYLLGAMMGLPFSHFLGATLAAAYAFVTGALAGAQYPLAVALMPEPWKSTAGRMAGRLYTADLLGGFAGGVLITLLLFPILGLAWTLLLLFIVKLATSVLLLLDRRMLQATDA